MWHRTTGIFDIIGARSHGFGSIWYMDHGGPYINPKADGIKHDEKLFLMFIHNRLHYFYPEAMYKYEGHTRR
jgi:hypothetical protein